jgi:hypothetical protein
VPRIQANVANHCCEDTLMPTSQDWLCLIDQTKPQPQSIWKFRSCIGGGGPLFHFSGRLQTTRSAQGRSCTSTMRSSLRRLSFPNAIGRGTPPFVFQTGSDRRRYLDEGNPNVFLEVGYAWGVERPTILALHETSEPPFDVRGHKILRYSRIGELKSMVAAELTGLSQQGIL